MDEFQKALLATLERLTVAVESLARGGGPVEPNLVRPIEEYPTFDWSAIGASVVQRDPDGPTHVEHQGGLYTRRSPQNKFDPAIWYSRANGRDDNGDVRYLRLITFKPLKDAESLPRGVEREIQARADQKPVEKPQPPAPARPRLEPKAELPTPEPGNPPAPVVPAILPDDMLHGPAAARPQSTQTARATTPPAPGMTIPNRRAQAAAPKTLDDLIKDATSIRRNLSEPAARAIADLAGGDIEMALRWLPFFAEAKASGWDFPASKALLQECSMDSGKALFTLRDRLKAALRSISAAR